MKTSGVTGFSNAFLYEWDDNNKKQRVIREYSFSGSTLISIFDDRIEFVSLGGLVKGIMMNDISQQPESSDHEKVIYQHVHKPKALLTDVGTEELAHIEMIATLVYKLTEGAAPWDFQKVGWGEQYEHRTGVFIIHMIIFLCLFDKAVMQKRP